MKLLTPRNLEDALTTLARESGRKATIMPIAGGTDVMVSWHHRPKSGMVLMDLSRLSDMAPMRLTDSHLTLGGLTTYWDVIRSTEVSKEFPLLTDAARQVGAIQIQTRGTWAG